MVMLHSEEEWWISAVTEMDDLHVLLLDELLCAVKTLPNGNARLRPGTGERMGEGGGHWE